MQVGLFTSYGASAAGLSGTVAMSFICKHFRCLIWLLAAAPTSGRGVFQGVGLRGDRSYSVIKLRACRRHRGGIESCTSFLGHGAR